MRKSAIQKQFKKVSSHKGMGMKKKPNTISIQHGIISITSSSNRQIKHLPPQTERNKLLAKLNTVSDKKRLLSIKSSIINVIEIFMKVCFPSYPFTYLSLKAKNQGKQTFQNIRHMFCLLVCKTLLYNSSTIVLSLIFKGVPYVEEFILKSAHMTNKTPLLPA